MLNSIYALIFLFSMIFQTSETTVFLVSDSTVADKPYGNGNPEKGWGQVFPLYFKDGINVENHAVNGRSTKSFIDEGRWATVLGRIRPGDYVFIEFGHNDEKKEDPARYGDPDSAYRANLQKFIAETRAKEGIPVLLTPIVRRRFNDAGEFYDSHGRYPEVVREVAKSEQVPLIDLENRSRELVSSYGSERSKQLYLHIKPGEYPSLPDGRTDDTHLSAVGAFHICDLVVAGIRENIPALTEYLKE